MSYTRLKMAHVNPYLLEKQKDMLGWVVHHGITKVQSANQLIERIPFGGIKGPHQLGHCCE